MATTDAPVETPVDKPVEKPKTAKELPLTPELYQRLAELSQINAIAPSMHDPVWEEGVDVAQGRVNDYVRRMMGAETPTMAATTPGAGATVGPPAAVTPVAMPGGPAAPMDPMAQQAGLLDIYRQQSGDVQSLLRDIQKRKQEIMSPALGGLRSAARTPLPPVPGMVAEPPIPSTKPSRFLETKPGADAQTAIMTIISGLGAMAQSIAGWRAPIGGLQAMTGMMQGWTEGDTARMSREYQQYEAQVQRMNRENSKALELYEQARTRRADDIGAAEIEIKAALAENGLLDHLGAIGQYGLEETGKLFTMNQNLITNQINNQMRVLDQNMRMMYLDQFIKRGGGPPGDDVITMLADMIQVEGRSDLAQKRMVGPWAGDMHSRVNQELVRRGHAPLPMPQDGMPPPPMPQAGGAPAGPGEAQAATPRGQSMASQVTEADLRFKKFKKEQDVLATRKANVETAVAEAEIMLPTLLEAFSGVSRTFSPRLNEWLISPALRNQPFSPDLSAAEQRLLTATNSFIPVYVRAMKGSGIPDVTSQEHARDMLSHGLNQNMATAALNQLHWEMQVAMKSPEYIYERILAERAGKPVPPVPTVLPPPPLTRAPAASTGEKGAAPSGPSVDELMKKYR